MTMGDRIKQTAQDVKGNAKEAVGKATDDKSMRAEGKGDQPSADVEKATDKTGYAAKDVLS